METVNNGNQPLQPYNHVLNDFSSRSGLDFDLSDGQKTTLNTILAQPEGEVYAKVYLGMAAAGVGLVAKDNPDSVKRLMQVLDGARQVWGGKNLDQQITSEKALHRLKTYTNIVLTRSAGTPLDNTRIGAIREDALDKANLHSGDVFEESAALPRLYATPQPQEDARFISAGDDGQDVEASVESIFQHAIPQDRGAGDLLPGTDEAWSAQGVAERLNTLLADAWDGTWDESQVLELTHGLNISDRIKVSEAYAKIRSEAGYPEFNDARNRPLAGEAALNALYTKLVSELGTNSRDGLRIKAQFDPTNPTGQLQAHDVVMLDLKGFWSKNGDAIQRLLMNCDPAQIQALDASLQENYDITLEKACKKLRGEDEDRALFLISAPRVDGEVPESYVQAYEIHQAMTLSFFRKDPNRAFRQLEAMSESDLRDVAQAWAELYPKKGQGGDDGTGASIESSKFYKFTHRRMGRLSLRAGSGLLQDRFETAARGLRFEADPQWSHAEHLAAAKEHRAKVADYCAVSFRLAGLRRGNQEDMVSVLGMVRPGSDVLGAMPRALDVFGAYNSRFPNEQNMTLTDIYNATSGEVEQLARITMEGKGFNSPEAAAIRLSNALDGGFLGLKGTKEEVVYEVLDQP
ncbi:MAG: hypothetical protein QGI45_11265, partial [Myxococcota bacterium]|nr:hypothetical protein [Myxococcota bacterium]